MTEQATLFCMQYRLRRGEVLEIAEAFELALDEDRRVNADMFDVTRVTFSKNPHANATMRALEARLGESDLSLLCLLFALLRVGADLSLGLADFGDATSFFEACAEEYARCEVRYTDAAYLARELTTPKAEHQKKRLATALRVMEGNL